MYRFAGSRGCVSHGQDHDITKKDTALKILSEKCPFGFLMVFFECSVNRQIRLQALSTAWRLPGWNRLTSEDLTVPLLPQHGLQK